MSSPLDMEADTLRRMLRAGGLEVGEERAARILPVVLSLLQGCDRIAALDLESPGGAGIAQVPEDRR